MRLIHSVSHVVNGIKQQQHTAVTAMKIKEKSFNHAVNILYVYITIVGNQRYKPDGTKLQLVLSTDLHNTTVPWKAFTSFHTGNVLCKKKKTFEVTVHESTGSPMTNNQ